MVGPAGQAPAMTISYVACGVEWAVVILFGIRHQRSQVGFGYHNVIMTLYQAARISFLYDADVRNIAPFAASCGRKGSYVDMPSYHYAVLAYPRPLQHRPEIGRGSFR